MQSEMKYIAKNSAANGEYFTLGELAEIISQFPYEGADYKIRTKGMVSPRISEIILIGPPLPAARLVPRDA